MLMSITRRLLIGALAGTLGSASCRLPWAKGGGHGHGSPPVLPGMPSVFSLGLYSKSTGTSDLAWMVGSGVPWNFRYNYVGTTTDHYAGIYVSDSLMNAYIPIITRYLGISPLSNLQNTSFMNAYYADFVAEIGSMKNWNLWYSMNSLGASVANVSVDGTTASYTGSSGTNATVLSGNYHNLGKWIFRIHWNAASGANNFVGIAANSLAIQYPGQAGFPTFGITSSGLFINDTIVSGQPAITYATNDDIDVAVDFDNKLVWARQNGGNWNGSSSYSPGGTGGASLSTMSSSSGGYAPCVLMKTTGDQAVFATPPIVSGFAEWNSTPASPVMIMHIEPDLWGYMQQGEVSGMQTDDPSMVVISVASSGYAGLSGLPNTAVGFAKALKLLRDTYAPSIYLAWHCSTWGPSDGFVATNTSFGEPPSTTGTRVANFYNALGTKFDLIFHDTTTGDADSDYGVLVRMLSAAFCWWTSTSFENYRQFLLGFHQALTTPTAGFVWQIAIGNTLFKSCNNTSNHYQDNKVEYFLTAGVSGQSAIYNSSAISNYISAGIYGILFGPGQPLDTENYDYAGDGVTNPAPITNGNGQSGNVLTATVSDDDGGFLKLAAAHYYGSPILLP